MNVNEHNVFEIWGGWQEQFKLVVEAAIAEGKVEHQHQKLLFQFCEILPTRLDAARFRFLDFQGHIKQGQILLDRLVMPDFVAAMESAIRDEGFRLQHPLKEFKPTFDDDAAMISNFSSGFNFRFIAGKPKLSVHAVGLAFDLNPMQNPRD